MSKDCYIVPKNPLIKELVPQASSPKELIDKIQAALGTGRPAVFKELNMDGKEVEVTKYVVAIENLTLAYIKHRETDLEIDGAGRQVGDMVRWGTTEGISESPTSSELRSNPSLIERVEEPPAEDIPNPRVSPDSNKYIKVPIKSTTTFEVSGIELDTTPLKKNQRRLLDKLYNNREDYYLVLVKDQEGIQRPEGIEPTGEVILAVHKDKYASPGNILEVAERVNDEVVPLYFEAPLGKGIDEASFFGFNNSEVESRTTSTHENRLQVLVESGMTLEEANEFYTKGFEDIQAMRKEGFVVLGIDDISVGHRVRNSDTLFDLGQEYFPKPSDVDIDPDGNMDAYYTINNQRVSLSLFGNDFSSGEKDWLVNNLTKYNEGDPDVQRVFDIMLGSSIRKNAFFKGQSLMFYDGEVSRSITDSTAFEALLNKYPYRNRSRLVSRQDPITMPDTNGKLKINLWEYFLKNFYPTEKFFEVEGALVPDVANRYISFERRGLPARSLDTQLNELNTAEVTVITEPTVVTDGTSVVVVMPTKDYAINPDELDRLVREYNKLSSTPIRKRKFDTKLRALQEVSGSGVYFPITDSIITSKESLAEEQVHALTVKYIRENPGSDEVKRIEELRQEAIKSIENPSPGVAHSLSNNEEFLARALVDQETIQALKKNLSSTWWNKLTELIRGILKKYNINNPPHGMFGDLLTVFDSIVQGPAAIDDISISPRVTKKIPFNFKKKTTDEEGDVFLSQVTIRESYSPRERLEVGRSMDSLMLNLLGNDLSSINTLYRDDVDMGVAIDFLSAGEPINPFHKKIQADPGYYRTIWENNSIIFSRPELLDADDTHVETKDEGNPEFQHDRPGNNIPTVDLIPNEVRAIYGLLPTKDEYTTGLPKLAQPIDIHYTLVDLMNGAQTMKEFVRRLNTLDGLPYRTLAKRLGVQTYDPKALTNEQWDILAMWHRSLHVPELDYHKLIKVKTKDGSRYEFIKATGKTQEAVYSKAIRSVHRLWYKVTKYRDIKKKVPVASKDYVNKLRSHIKNEDWRAYVNLLGLDIHIDRQLRNTLRSFKDGLIRDTKSVLGESDPMRALVRAKDSQTRAYDMIISRIDSKKTRSIQGPDGQLISAETLPNSLTQLVDLLNDPRKGPYEELGPEFGFILGPRFKYSQSYNRIFNGGEKIKLISYGGIEDRGKTTKLNGKDWLRMNLITMLDKGFMEMMRTESSSSAWAFKVGNLAWANSDAQFYKAFAGYFLGELETIKGTHLADYDTGRGLSYFSFLPEALKSSILGDISTMSPADVARKYWPEVQEAVGTMLDNQFKEVQGAVAELNIKEKGYTEKEPLMQFTRNYIIQNIEESLLFSNSIDFYKAFHKRAKLKISTGTTPVIDQDFWEKMGEDTIGGRPMSPIHNVINIKEDTVSYIGELVKEGNRDVPVDKTTEYTRLFLPMFEHKVNHLIQANIVEPRYKKGKLDLSHPSLDTHWNTLIRKFSDGYGSMDVGDGGGMVNMDYYRAYLRSVGNWPERAEGHYQWERLFYKKFYQNQELLTEGTFMRHNGKGYSEADFFKLGYYANYAQASLKMSYFGPDMSHGLPIAHKFALFPLTPSVVYGTKLQNLVPIFVNQNISYGTFESGTKAAKGGPMQPISLLDDDRNLPPTNQVIDQIGKGMYQIDVRYLKEQLKTDNKVKETNIFGSQMRKLIFSDVMEYGVPRDFIPTDKVGRDKFFKAVLKGQSMSSFKKLPRVAQFNKILDYYETQPDTPFHSRMREYQSLLNDLVKVKEEQLLGELGMIKTNEGIEIFDLDLTLRALSKKTLDKPQAMIDFLELNRGSTNELVIPLEASPSRQGFQNILTSMAKKALVNIKVNGGQLIQVPSTLTEPEGFVWDKDKTSMTGLRFYEVRDGEVLPAQAKVALTGQFKFLTRRKDVRDYARENGKSPLRALNEMLSKDLLPKELITFVAYRIPTQGISSMEVLEVKEFLPPRAGKTIITPLEIVAKTGSDYDIDKLSVVYPNISERGEFVDSVDQFSKEGLAQAKEVYKRFSNEINRLKSENRVTSDEINYIKTLSWSTDPSAALAFDEAVAEFKERDEEIGSLLEEVAKVNLALDQFAKDKAGKLAEIQNKLIGVMQAQILDINNFHQLITPLTTNDIKGTLKENGIDWHTDISDPRMSDIFMFRKNLNKRNALLVGGQLLGIAAVNTTFNQVYQANGAKVKDSVKTLLLKEKERESMLDGEWLRLDSQYTVDGLLKSELYNQYVNATVDAATDDYLGYANFTKQTMPVAMWLTQQGVPVKRYANLIHSEGVRTYLNKTFKDKTKYLKKLENQLYTKAGIKPGTSKTKLKTLNTAFSKDLLNLGEYHTDFTEMDASSRQSKDYWYWRRQYDSVRAFLELKEQADQMFLVQDALNWDTAPSKTPVEAFLYGKKLKAAKGTFIDNDFLDRVIKDSVISPFNMNETYLGIMGSLMPIVFDRETMELLSLMRVPSNFDTPSQSEKDTFYRTLTNDLLEYLVKTRGTKAGLKLGEWGEDQVVNHIQDYLNERPHLSNLSFFKDLSLGLAQDGNPFLRLVRDSRGTDVSNIYTNDLKEAMEIDPDFVRDLSLIGFLQTGYNRTFYSWSDLIPPEIISGQINELIKEPATREELEQFEVNFRANNPNLYSKRRTPRSYKYAEIKEVDDSIFDLVPEDSEEVPIDIEIYWGGKNKNLSEIHPNRILSNLAKRPFEYNGRGYLSVEHAYQVLKSGSFDQVTYDKYKIKGGYGVKIRGKAPDRNTNLQLMEELVLESFKQNPNSEPSWVLYNSGTLTHPTNELIDQAFLRGLQKAKEWLVSYGEAFESLSEDSNNEAQGEFTFDKESVEARQDYKIFEYIRSIQFNSKSIKDETGLKVGTQFDINPSWVSNKSLHTIQSVSEDIVSEYGFDPQEVRDEIISMVGLTKKEISDRYEQLWNPALSSVRLVDDFINSKGNEVSFLLKSVNILNSEKAINMFEKGRKNKWSLDKILTELQVPKYQKQLILNTDFGDTYIGDVSLRENILISLVADNTFAVNINIAKNSTKDALGGVLVRDYPGKKIGDSITIGDDVYKILNIQKTNDPNDRGDGLPQIDRFVLSNTGENTQYYSNLTVPGGTNYSENEISTPNIVPNIKGHAQFSTDNGIGWFRSDDKGYDERLETRIQRTTDKDGKEVYFIYSDTIPGSDERVNKLFDTLKEAQAFQKSVSDNKNTKTRRVLELQSDLFQKGRGKEELVDQFGLRRNIVDINEKVAYLKENGIVINEVDGTFDILVKGEVVAEYIKTKQKAVDIGESFQGTEDKVISNRRKNQFLQILNKKNNWVTFFIKAIIQDSAKKGYEKVLFPRGNTAAKIEGHETLDQFKTSKQDRIKVLEAQDSNYLSQEYDLVRDNLPEEINRRDYIRSNLERTKNELTQLRQELVDVELGKTQLSSIANFYENTITNILKKNYNNSILEVTDEHGNTWNEIDITPKNNYTIKPLSYYDC